MQSAERDLIADLPKETVAFFAVFSRFECALKRSGYLQNKKGAEAHWYKFAKELGEPFLDEVRSRGDACELIRRPPKKQINKNGQLAWQTTTQITDVNGLFLAVRRVRNNLFHGGKYPQGQLDDTSRNEKLLLQAKSVLERALEKSPKVKRFFDKDF